ncbi:MAG: 1,4-alpha-glucan branching protein GlgB [Bacteroidia bacterium]
MVKPTSLFTDYDIHLFREGKHYRIYEKMGAHLHEFEGEQGVYFAVWAPNAERVSVIGDFNYWSAGADELFPRLDGSGIWEGFIPKLGKGVNYKYHISSRDGSIPIEKGDPYGFLWESPPKTASVVWDLDYAWQDADWMKKRKEHNKLSAPYAVYEVHLGSWRRNPDEGGRSLYYFELAEELVAYVQEMGYTHVELMPVMEHPFFGSWGYQVTGYFAPSSRFGNPQEFMYLIDRLHQAGIGVILDWVPSHFPTDGHGLAFFDGTHLYEHADPRKGYHPDWKSYIFNYGRNEVRSFLISNALFWLDKYHADGLRVDAVASMLYLDYSREEGQWIPNEFGGRENLEAISLLKEMNREAYLAFPDIQTIAEESTAWPMVSRPIDMGGLGFGMKWMMGWMHDTLAYFKENPLFRPFHHDKITFSIMYAFNENFMMPLSHDEVVHGKGSMINKMPGDEWQKFANLRLLYGYMYTHPGAKLNFMGGELGQAREWNHDSSLDWHLLDYHLHRGLNESVKALNKLYRSEKALYELQFDAAGYEWIDGSDRSNSVITYMRKDLEGNALLVVCNFTPVVRDQYRIGVPEEGFYEEIFSTDRIEFGGSGVLNAEPIAAEYFHYQWKDHSLQLRLPPLGMLILRKMEAVKKPVKAKRTAKEQSTTQSTGSKDSATSPAKPSRKKTASPKGEKTAAKPKTVGETKSGKSPSAKPKSNTKANKS